MNKLYSDDELLLHIIKLRKELNRLPTKKDMDEAEGYPSGAIYWYRFGSWSNSLKRAGLKPRKLEYTNRELINHLQKLAEGLGHSPRRIDIDKTKDFPTLDTYKRRFGSYEKALLEAGLKPIHPYTQITNEELIEELKDVAGVLGHTPTQSEMIERGDYHPSTYQDRFGSWKEAIKKAGLEVIFKGFPDKKLLDDLRKLAKELGHAPSRNELIEAGGYPNPRTYSDRFGSWKEAIKKAGLPPVERGYSDKELFEYMMRLTEELGRMPFFQEMMVAEGYPSPATYTNHFGSWRKAKLTFQEWKAARERSEVNVINLCREYGLSYLTIRDFTMTILDKKRLDPYMMHMDDKDAVKYLEFIKDNFYALCNRMGIKEPPKKIWMEREQRKYRYDDIPLIVDVLRVE